MMACQRFFDRKATISAMPLRTRGFSLVELMVAMVLGLVLIAGAASVFFSAERTYHTNDALGEVQSHARFAYELLIRDIRQAGFTGCNKSGSVSTQLKNAPSNGGTAWWADWSNAVKGYDGGVADPGITAGRVSGTDSLVLIGATGGGFAVTAVDDGTGSFSIARSTTNLATNDIIMVCDTSHAVTMQISSYDQTGLAVLHVQDVGAPGNVSNISGLDLNKSPRVFKFSARDWYIGSNPVGGDSLYRVDVSKGVATNQEMVRGVTNMQLQYHEQNGTNFVDAGAVTNWNTVDAVKTTLTLESSDQEAGSDNAPITRSFTTTTAIRNR